MLYELVVEQLYYNQQVINRWNYLSTSTPASVTLSFALVSAFGGIPDALSHAFPAGSIMEGMFHVQATALTYVSIVAKAVYDPVDFYTTPFPVGQVGGAATGEAMSPMTAWGIRSNQVRTDIKSGQKRFAGCTEGSVNPGGVVEAGMLGLLQTLADRMSGPITYDDEGSILTFTPCVVQKEKYTTPSGKNAYRYYIDEDVQVPAHVAQNPTWSPKTTVRSQTSRQYGRGS